MTQEPLEELYFKWLYRQVAPARLKNPVRTYWDLLAKLHNKEFLWFVPNDDNRAMDGKYLRYEFLDSQPPGVQNAEHSWLETGCSMLEMMIALARRLAFYGGGASSAWFWHMIDNLGLRGCTDATPGSPEEVDRILNRVIERTYDKNGNGGLFPLKETKRDQRRVELWYQMNYYLIERG